MCSHRKPYLPLTDAERDAIGVVLSIASVRAGHALSQLTGASIQINPPQVVEMALGEVPPFFGGMEAPALGVLVPFEGDVNGDTLLLFPEDGMREMEQLLFGDGRAPGPEMRDSAFAEVGNILSGAYLTVLSTLSGKLLLSQPPSVARDMAGAIIDAILAGVGASSDTVLAIISGICREEGPSLVRSIFFPDQAGVSLLMEAAQRLKDPG